MTSIEEKRTSDDDASSPSAGNGGGPEVLPCPNTVKEGSDVDDQLTETPSGGTNDKSLQDGDGDGDEDRDQNGDLTRARTARDEPPEGSHAVATVSTVGPIHSVFTKNQKRFIVVMASWAGFFSPVSANIYFPALNELAHDLKVTSTLINLTLTSYMVRVVPVSR